MKTPPFPSRVSVLALLVALSGLNAFWWPVAAQSSTLPGVRGWLYESPTYGWILVPPEPEWRIANAGTDGSRDWVQLTADAGDEADDVFVSYLDDGRGEDGCVHDLVDTLADLYDGSPLQGWRESAVEFEEIGPPGARARVVRSQGPGLDIMASIRCSQSSGGPLLIGELLLRTERDLDAGTTQSIPMPFFPGDTHTGRARGGRAPDGVSEPGVVRFGARGAPLELHWPFNCNDQETFAPPVQPPPPDKGYFACDGQITNLDVVPATVDLGNIVLGCERIPPDEPLPAGCTGVLVAPVAFDILEAPDGGDDQVLTLAPGDVVEVVLWYALPEGDVPLDIYYLEPDRQPPVVAGSTFFTQGTGSRPKVRLSR